MLILRFSLLLGLTILSLANCKKPASTAAGSPSPSTPRIAQPKIEACSLITKEEVEAIQGTTILESKGSAGPNGSFLVSQCYYSSGEPNKSVSVAVTQANPTESSGVEPAKYWEQTFGAYRKDKPEAEREKDAEENKGKKEPARHGEEENEKARAPKKIAGVGEEAYWAGNRFGGALYVLKGNVFVRVSVGGPDNEETKINKSKALAEKAIGRL